MAQIIYKINTGTPDFTVHLEPSVSPDQIQNALGTYSFTGITADTYSITIIDSNGCIGFKDNIIAVDETTTTTTTVAETTTTTTTIIAACFSGSTIFDTAYGGKILNIYSANTAALIVLPFADWGEGFSGFTSWDVAMSAVTTLSAGGFNDWRLPTVSEWNTIGFTSGVSTALGWYEFTAYWSSDEIDISNSYKWLTSDDTTDTYGGLYNMSVSEPKITTGIYGLAVRNAYC